MIYDIISTRNKTSFPKGQPKKFQESKADTVPFAAPMGGGKHKSTFAQDFPRSDPKQFGIDNFLRSGRSEGYHQKSIRIRRKQHAKIK